MPNKTTILNQISSGRFRGSLIIIALLLNCLFLTLAWQNNNTIFLVLVTFVPFFLLLELQSPDYNQRLQLHLFSFLAVFISIYFIIYWIRNVDPGSHLATVAVRAITVYLPYLSAFFIRFGLRRSAVDSVLGFCFTWMITEVLHDLNILGLPYGNLGHLFGGKPAIIQWYSITGSSGGTAWILLVNFSIYYFLRSLFQRKNSPRSRVRSSIVLAITALAPPIFSLSIPKMEIQCHKTDIRVLALHTSMDVYKYKYEASPLDLVGEYIDQTSPSLDTSVKTIIFWPENAITGDILYSQPDSSMAIKKIKHELVRQPCINLVTGAIVDNIVTPPRKDVYAPGIMKDTISGKHFRRYNTALLLKCNQPTETKIKKRLVPFSEEIPPNPVFAPLVKLVPNLEGLSFSRGEQDTVVFSFFGDRARTSPIICYGSTFSPFVAREILASNSNFMTIILNEGWMKSKKANAHFNWFTICRAIENRRYAVKSSNEGISSIIGCDGSVLNSLEGPLPGVIKSSLRINNSFTFYTKNHKGILYGILIVSIAGLVWIILKKSCSIPGTAPDLFRLKD